MQEDKTRLISSETCGTEVEQFLYEAGFVDRGNVVFLHKLPKVVHGGQEYNAGVTEYRKKKGVMEYQY